MTLRKRFLLIFLLAVTGLADASRPALTTDLSLQGFWVHQLVADPSTPGRVYALMRFGNLLRSDDAGITWTRLSTISTVPSSVKELAVDPVRPRFLYFADSNWLQASSDGGVTWSNRFDFNPLVEKWGGTHWHGYVKRIAVHPRQSNTLYIHFVANFVLSSRNLLFKSTDRGLSFELILELGHWDFFLDPSDSQRLYTTNFTESSLYRTNNGGSSWQLVYESNTGYLGSLGSLDSWVV